MRIPNVADWSQMVAELASAADIYKDPLRGIQIVGGSGAIAHSFQQYRELGAKTRAMLVATAADHWHVTRPTNAAQQTVSFMVQAINQLVMPSSRMRLHDLQCRKKYVSRIRQSFGSLARECGDLIAERSVMVRKSLDSIWIFRE